VTGPHGDHIIAFARRRGHDAAIVVVAKCSAPLSQGGRAWPGAAAFDGALQIKGYKVEGIHGAGGATEAPLSVLFQRLPVTVLKARFEGALKPVRKRMLA
jgi:(1->4)-alpha-D-glucan 1-alpha-D-glucosylmutase